MKRDGLLDELSARSLDAAWLREALAPASPYGEREFAGLAPFRRGEEGFDGREGIGNETGRRPLRDIGPLGGGQDHALQRNN